MVRKITKRALSLSIVLALALTLGIGGLLPAAAAAEGDTFEFQILFTSDLHGCFSDWNYGTDASGQGLARLAPKIKELKNDATILIDVGDTIQGNGTTIFHGDTWDNMYPVLIGMEYLGFDAWILGNHEFNFGIPALEKAFGKGMAEDGGNLFSGAVLAGNVFDAEGNQVFDAYLIKEFDNGLRVALIGMTHPNIVAWDAANMRNAGYTAESAAVITEKTIQYLKDNDLADIFIATQHMGPAGRYDAPGSAAEEVIAYGSNAENLALFIGGHDHTLHAGREIEGVKFFEVRNAARELGQVTVTATQTADGWVVADKIEDVKFANYELRSTEADAGYMEAVAEADEFGKANARTIIGEFIGEPLVPDPEIAGTYEAYLQDTALVHLINDAMLHYTNVYINESDFFEKYPQYAGMAVTLSGTAPLDTNANHKAGPITKGSVSTIYKYDNNTLYLMAITGAQFKQWMEWSYAFIGPYIDNGVWDYGPAMVPGDLTIPYGNANFAGYNMDQFKGLTYKVDLTKPIGERIVDMVYDATGEPFDLDATYLCAVNNYRADSQLTAANSTIYPGASAAEKPVILAEEIERIYPGTAEGMLGVMVDYIDKELGGIVDNTDNRIEKTSWTYILPEIDPELRAKAVAAINSGEIDIVVGGYNRRAVKDYEVDPSIAPPVPGDTYIVSPGDSLWRLAKRFYGSGAKWNLLYEANKSVIGSDPNIIVIGTPLNLPA